MSLSRKLSTRQRKKKNRTAYFHLVCLLTPYSTVNVKQSLYRPGHALRLSEGSHISRHEGGKVVKPTHRPPLPTPPSPQEIFLVLNSVRCWVKPMVTERPVTDRWLL